MIVESAVGTKVIAGSLTVGTSTVQLASLSTKVKFGFYVKANSGNSGTIYVGGSDVSATRGYPLIASEWVPIAVEDLSLLFAVASGSNQTLHYIGA